MFSLDIVLSATLIRVSIFSNVPIEIKLAIYNVEKILVMVSKNTTNMVLTTIANNFVRPLSGNPPKSPRNISLCCSF